MASGHRSKKAADAPRPTPRPRRRKQLVKQQPSESQSSPPIENIPDFSTASTTDSYSFLQGDHAVAVAVAGGDGSGETSAVGAIASKSKIKKKNPVTHAPQGNFHHADDKIRKGSEKNISASNNGGNKNNLQRDSQTKKVNRNAREKLSMSHDKENVDNDSSKILTNSPQNEAVLDRSKAEVTRVENARITERESKKKSSKADNSPSTASCINKHNNLTSTSKQSRSTENEINDLSDTMARVTLSKANKNSSKTPTATLESESVLKTQDVHPFPPLGFGSKNIVVEPSNSGGGAKSRLEKAIKTLEKWGDDSFPSLKKLFSTPHLLEKVSEASFNTSPAGSILLEENVPKLIDATKRCLKSLANMATTSNSSSEKRFADGSKEADKSASLLRIAIHSLRAILAAIDLDNTSRSTLQTIAKLFYHCVLNAGDACYHEFQVFSSSPHLSKGELAVFDFSLLCLAACEGLGRLMRSFGWIGSKVADSDTIYGKCFKTVGRNNLLWDQIFPLPHNDSNIGLVENNVAGSKNTTILPYRQVLKMIIESSLCASSSFLHMSLVALHLHSDDGRSWSVANEFCFAADAVFHASSGDIDESPMFQKLIRNVSYPCVIASLFAGDEDAQPENRSCKLESSLNLDSIRLAKKNFRVGWDGARCVENLFSTNKDPILRTCCLNLQNNAIFCLLQFIIEIAVNMKTMSGMSSGREEIVSLFDTASSSAMKSVAKFEKLLGKPIDDNSLAGDMKKALLEFHYFVGGMLDKTSRCFSSTLALPPSYFEYCIYRSVHQWKFHRSVDMTAKQVSFLMDTYTKHVVKGSESKASMASLAFVYLFFQASFALARKEKTPELSESYIEQIVSMFERDVIKCETLSIKSRCRTMLLLLDIPITASRIIASAQEPGTFADKGVWLFVMASLLGQCLAPLEDSISTESSNFNLLASDNRVRSASLIEAAVVRSSSSSIDFKKAYFVDVDALLQKSYQTLVSLLNKAESFQTDAKSPLVISAELFARAAFQVGRRRIDMQEDMASVQPQLYAIEILTMLSRNSSQENSFGKYQISSRYMILSSTFEKLGNIVESCSALSLSAWTAVKHHNFENKSNNGTVNSGQREHVSRRVLLFPGDLLSFKSSQKDDSLSSVLRPIFLKLIRAYISHLKSLIEDFVEADENEIGKSASSFSLNDTMVGRVMGISKCSPCADERAVAGPTFLNQKIRMSMLLKFILWDGSHEPILPIPETTEIVTEFLWGVSKLLRSLFAQDNNRHSSFEFLLQHLLHEQTQLVQLQLELLGEHSSNEGIRIISSSLHLSLALLPMDSFFLCFPQSSTWISPTLTLDDIDQILVNNACNQLQLSEECFSASFYDKTCNHDALFFASWAATQFHHAIFSEHLFGSKCLESFQDSHTNSQGCGELVGQIMQQYRSVLTTCSHAASHLDIFCDEIPSSEILQSLMSTLRRLFHRFCCHGDPISSSNCFVLLQKIYSISAQPQFIFQGLSDFVMIASIFIDLAPTFMDHSVFHKEKGDRNILHEGVFSIMDANGAPLAEINLNQSFIGAMEIITELIKDKHVGRSQLQCLDQSLRQILTVVNQDEDSIEVSRTSPNFIHIHHFVSMTLLLAAKMLLSKGFPGNAIKYLHWCRFECKKLTRSMHHARASLGSSSFDDLSTQIENALSMYYEQLASCFSLLGIRRKAEDNFILAAMKLKIVDPSNNMKSSLKIQDLLDLLAVYNGVDGILHFIHSILNMKSSSLSPDIISSELTKEPSFERFTAMNSDDYLVLTNGIVNHSKSLFACIDALYCTLLFRTKASHYLKEAHQAFGVLESKADGNFPSMIDLESFIGRILVELRLRMATSIEIATTFPKCVSRVADESTSLKIKDILESKYASKTSRAEGYYELGLKSLFDAVENGSIRQLWSHYSVVAGETCGVSEFDDVTSSFESLYLARKYLKCALLNACPASGSLARNILRCLALVTGPDDDKSEMNLSTAALVHISVGASARNVVRDGLSKADLAYDDCEVNEIFETFDDETLNMEEKSESVRGFLQNAANMIPTSWNISTMVTCPTGEILISSLRPTIRTICIFPENKGDHGTSISTIHDDLLIPLDSIIKRSQNQLSGINVDVQNEQYNEESSRRKWWDERHSIDADLQSLLQVAQTKYFGHDAVRKSIVPRELDSKTDEVSSDDDSSGCSVVNLASRFEEIGREDCETSEEFDEESERENLKKLTVPIIKKRIQDYGSNAKNINKLRKPELIELLLSEIQLRARKEKAKAADVSEMPQAPDAKDSDSISEIENVIESGGPCTILVLDEHLHRFPFEGMEMFTGKAVTRVPSIVFAIATLVEMKKMNSLGAPEVNPSKLKYVLDPESNLNETASTLEPALNSLASKNGWTWNGVVGEMPPSEFMMQSLLEESGLFLYCGHGGGEKAFSRSQVESMIVPNEAADGDPCLVPNQARCCRSSVVLMGCSSGKLQSVNTPRENPDGIVYPMHYEPEGIALSYLFAGAPCVIGNLWDVTDRDIDRYCLTLMEDFLDKSRDGSSEKKPSSLAKCVADARRACKLRHIVGCAPICYGIPVICAPSEDSI